MLRMFSKYFKDLDFSPDAYMQDRWLKKGPRGDFMKDKYTLENMCELGFYPMRHGYGLYGDEAIFTVD